MSIDNAQALKMPLEDLTPVEYSEGEPLKYWTDNIQVGDRVLRVHEVWYLDKSYSVSRMIIRVATVNPLYIVDAGKTSVYERGWESDPDSTFPQKQKITYFLLESDR